MLILGSCPTDEAIAKARRLAKNNQVLSVNSAFKYYDIKPDFQICQDLVLNAADKIITKEVLTSDYNLRGLGNKIEWFFNVQKPDLNKDSRNLCFYPYTGVAAIDYCFKKGYNKIFIAGFTFGRYHNYPNKIQIRDKGTNMLYVRNVKLLADVIKIYSLQENEIGLEVI